MGITGYHFDFERGKNGSSGSDGGAAAGTRRIAADLWVSDTFVRVRLLLCWCWRNGRRRNGGRSILHLRRREWLVLGILSLREPEVAVSIKDEHQRYQKQHQCREH